MVESAGPTETRNVEIEDVSAIDLRTSGDLTIRRGDTPSLTITAGERTQDRLTSEVRNGVLVLDARGDFGIRIGGSISYELVVTELSDLVVAGSGDVSASDVVGADGLQVQIEGSGDVDIDQIDTADVWVSVEGSGGVDLSGRADGAGVSIEGSGGVDLGDLAVAEADVSIEGSGEVEVDARDRLAVSISGSGSVRYSGNPDLTQDISGSGDVRQG
ncbi:head GIN domain-containing protein [Cellulomonas denverensis]|uniref:head GIN domain-containing protein n=1 Tax=Cellulomonas denverensis TaxID=264297 RepID=UPI0035EBCD8F